MGHDADNRSVEILKNDRSRNTKGSDTACGEPCVASRIFLGIIGAIMRFAIYLDYQTGFMTVEIGHIVAGRMLPPKSQARGALAERLGTPPLALVGPGEGAEFDTPRLASMGFVRWRTALPC